MNITKNKVTRKSTSNSHKTNKLPMPEVVKSIKEVKPFVVYTTIIHDLIKANVGNRILNRKKVNYFKKEQKEGRLYPVVFLADYITRELNDSHHKFQAYKELNLPITFVLVDLGEPFRNKDTRVEAIEHLNSTQSKWTPNDRYLKAIESGFTGAEIIKARIELLDDKDPNHGIKPWNLFQFALSNNIQSTVKYKDYNSDENIKVLTSNKFRKEFNALLLIQSKLSLMVMSIKQSDFIKRLSILKSDDDFNIMDFAKNFSLYYKSFKPKTSKVGDLDKAIFKILKKK